MREHPLDIIAPGRGSSHSHQPPLVSHTCPPRKTCPLLPPGEDVLQVTDTQRLRNNLPPRHEGIVQPPNASHGGVPGCFLALLWLLLSLEVPSAPQEPSLCPLPSTSPESHRGSQHVFWTDPATGVTKRAGHTGGTVWMGVFVPKCSGRVGVTPPSLSSYMHLSFLPLLLILYFFPPFFEQLFSNKLLMMIQ